MQWAAALVSASLAVDADGSVAATAYKASALPCMLTTYRQCVRMLLLYPQLLLLLLPELLLVLLPTNL